MIRESQTTERCFTLTGRLVQARHFIKAVAGEAGVPFFSIGSDFVEMFVYAGASRVRDLFGYTKRAPRIVFIDEIDRCRPSAWRRLSGGHDEREQT